LPVIRAVESEDNMDRASRILSVLSVTLVVCAFILRVAVPQTLFLPFGRPFGSHYVRAGWLAFWVFLIVGLLVGAVAFLRVTIRKLG
jgi:hypothetical protein